MLGKKYRNYLWVVWGRWVSTWKRAYKHLVVAFHVLRLGLSFPDHHVLCQSSVEELHCLGNACQWVATLLYLWRWYQSDFYLFTQQYLVYFFSFYEKTQCFRGKWLSKREKHSYSKMKSSSRLWKQNAICAH